MTEVALIGFHTSLASQWQVSIKIKQIEVFLMVISFTLVTCNIAYFYILYILRLFLAIG